MKYILLTLLFVPLYLGCLFWAAKQSPEFRAEQELIRQCHSLGGQMIPRTRMCVKPENLLIPIPR